ncbi:CopG family transcriptional regulator [Corynebacterium sp. FDAARGOS 1242]|uniref:CopG family transcriptional regulator n=1 Tax=Corynebacterium sp. FDAARGOS 1242 TaxID=2778078 RepID=UPI0019503159|nr:CopG family transcriptional regulator [Corynebacterium sp. FDAARGOS 1242]QRP97377.1 CopG family transcriptional regulator [Corynebacterium sp. FDAARGOS 1242]
MSINLRLTEEQAKHLTLLAGQAGLSKQQYMVSIIEKEFEKLVARDYVARHFADISEYRSELLERLKDA